MVHIRSEEGQDLVEYALLLALIAVVCLLGLNVLGGQAQQFYMNLAQYLHDNVTI